MSVLSTALGLEETSLGPAIDDIACDSVDSYMLSKLSFEDSEEDLWRSIEPLLVALAVSPSAEIVSVRGLPGASVFVVEGNVHAVRLVGQARLFAETRVLLDGRDALDQGGIRAAAYFEASGLVAYIEEGRFRTRRVLPAKPELISVPMSSKEELDVAIWAEPHSPLQTFADGIDLPRGFLEALRVHEPAYGIDGLLAAAWVAVVAAFAPESRIQQVAAWQQGRGRPLARLEAKLSALGGALDPWLDQAELERLDAFTELKDEVKDLSSSNSEDEREGAALALRRVRAELALLNYLRSRRLEGDTKTCQSIDATALLIAEDIRLDALEDMPLLALGRALVQAGCFPTLPEDYRPWFTRA